MKEKQDEKWIKENINIYTEMAAYVEKVGANNVDAKALEALNLIMQANST
jgi:post-segregation antitoxin (ccd killing protein)